MGSRANSRAARALRRGRAVVLGVVSLGLLACAGREDQVGGPMTEMQKNETIRRAIRSSSEGVIFLPSRKAEQVYELPRLNEIAQGLRQPAAACFLQRALETMEPAPQTEEGFVGVPDGQVKLRARIGPNGQVLRTEVLESGFDDEAVPQCVAKAIRQKRFPENPSGTNHYIDIIYWVSLGMAADLKSATMQKHLRKETVQAAIRAKPCVTGRVSPGSYTVEGLNLVGPDGSTMANRVDQSSLPEDSRKCVARAFREIRLPADKTTFVRPVMPTVRFDVKADGTIAVADEDWLRLVQLEERAQRAQQRADLGVEVGEDAKPSLVDEGEPDGVIAGEATVQVDDGAAVSGDKEDPPPSVEPKPKPKKPKKDPGKGGLKIDLGTRGSDAARPPSEPSPAAPTEE
jgi:hypothetical protein